MKQIRKFAALILAFSVLFSLAVPTFAASSVQSEVQSSAAFMLSSVKSPEVGSIGGEWAVIGLARSGYSVPADYYDEYYTRVEKYVKNCSGVLHERKYTEYSRVILALTAIGRDPSTVTALVKKLAAAGYVRTEKGVEDRRATIVSLTERGRGLRGEFEAVSKELSVVQGLGIDPTDMETARRVLGTVRDNFEHALKKEDGHGRGA